jgi:hypothetical protein
MDELKGITPCLPFPPPVVEMLTSKLVVDETSADDDTADATSYSHDGNVSRMGGLASYSCFSFISPLR